MVSACSNCSNSSSETNIIGSGSTSGNSRDNHTNTSSHTSRCRDSSTLNPNRNVRSTETTASLSSAAKSMGGVSGYSADYESLPKTSAVPSATALSSNLRSGIMKGMDSNNHRRKTTSSSQTSSRNGNKTDPPLSTIDMIISASKQRKSEQISISTLSSLYEHDQHHHKVSTKNHHHNHNSSSNMIEKRRKRDEMNYLASVVKDDMERGGLVYSLYSQSNKRIRVLPPGSNIDILSSVQLMTHHDLSSSPFLIDQIINRMQNKQPSNDADNKDSNKLGINTPIYSSFFDDSYIRSANIGVTATTNSTIEMIKTSNVSETVVNGPLQPSSTNIMKTVHWDKANILSDLVKSCSSMYEYHHIQEQDTSSNQDDKEDVMEQKRRKQQKQSRTKVDSNGSRSDSSATSSVTGSDSDDVIQQPDNTKHSHHHNANANLTTVKADTILQQPNNGLISIGDALSISPNARLIVLATAPYLVIQANAAFLRYTGWMSSNVLGRPLSHLLSCEHNDNTNQLLHALKESSESLQTSTVSNGLATFQRVSNKLNVAHCDLQSNDPPKIVVVSPVGSKGCSISHFSIELQNISTSASSIRSNTNMLNRRITENQNRLYEEIDQQRNVDRTNTFLNMNVMG